ncbi:heterokaryon incompatibility protein-domain-containing protein [Cenococcum geophilum]
MDTLSLDPEFHTPFCALSYMWGSSAVKRPVRINGIDAEITENLYLALLDLCRSPMGNIPYWWVDALCIDQENAEERRIQVQMMTRIYSSASETVAHFGALNPSAGLRMLGTLAVRRTMPNPAVWMIEAASDEALAADWQALHALLHAPYWSRVWILQETIVSTRLLLFDPAGPWLDIWRALQAFVFIMVMQPIISVPLMENAKVNFGHEFMAVHRQLGLKRKYYPDEGAGTVAAMKATATPPPFLIALCSALQLKATDPRDHLYALLGLTQGGKKLIGAPDYAASPGTVFATFLRSYCHEFQDLDMMLLSSPTRRLPGLPSWVPDLSSFEGHYYRNSIVLETLRTIGNNLDNVVKDKAYLEKGRFHASRFLPTDAEFSDDLRVLTISGINLGRIAGLGGYVGMTITEEGHGNLQDPTPCTQRTEGATASPPSTDRAWILEAVASALTPGILQPPLPAEDDALRKQLPFGLRGEILAAVVHLAVDKKLTSPFLWGLENWWTQNKDLVVRGRTLADWVLGDDLTSEARQTELTKAKHELNETVWRGVAMEGMLNIFLSRLSHVTLEMQRRLLVTVDGQVGLAPDSCHPATIASWRV